MNIKGTLYILAFIVIIAFAGVYQANLSQTIHPSVFIFVSSVIGLLIFSGMSFFHNGFGFIKKFRLQKRNIILLNVANFMVWFFYMFSLKYLEPALVVVIANAIGPLLVIILSKYLRPGSRIFKLEKIGAVGIFLGLVFILYMTLNGQSALQYVHEQELKTGVIFAAIAGIGQVLFVISSKKLSDASFTPSEILAGRYWLIIFVSLFLLDTAQLTAALTQFDSSIRIFALSVFGLALPIFLYQKGVKLTEPIFAAVLMILEPIIMFVGQAFDPRLRISLYSYIGVFLISVFSLLSVFGRYLGEKKHHISAKN